jgi:RNA polymerase sigma factor (TIGR02999 family)
MQAAPAPGDITQLLRKWRAGDVSAQAALFEAIYPELRRIASNRVRSQGPQATLHPTELIHEAWIRLAESRGMSFEDRARFYGAAATIMRHILVDRARARASSKRTPDGAWPVVSPAPEGLDYPAISAALDALQVVCERQARQVDLRFFGGFSAQESAEILGISVATLKRDWLAARMFIKAHIENSR